MDGEQGWVDNLVSGGVELTEEVQLIDVDSEIQPDNSFPRAHAIYVILSHEPSATWQREFERVCKLKVSTRKRIMTIVGSRLRVVISPTEHVETVLRQVQGAVLDTNERLGGQANPPT